MINPAQFVLELVLVVAALALSRGLTGGDRRWVIGITALAAATNCAFYTFAVGPLYLAKGFDRSVIAVTVTVETIRWGVLALVLSRFALRLQDAGRTSGFALRRNRAGLARLLGLGVGVGVVTAVAMYLLSFLEYRVGYLDRLPWPGASGEPIDIRMAVGGLRNLVGEEIFARLGAQCIALHLFRRLRGGAGVAIVASAAYFEIWHNPFETPQFLNFAGSCVLGWAYHRYGYEVAAVGHCVVDWLILGILPLMLFR